ncbi:bifunctional glycosyltransferase/CDP-glycerol:glycerophosphate glycerophosphotransferase [Paenibacillus vandeheii]
MSYIISVIIPVYNSEPYIAECLNSIINQTIGIKNIEVILINDGSNDKSMEIMKEYSILYSSIKIIDLQKNIGTGPSRNLGLEKATGKYISFIDSDDFISLNTFEHSIICIERTSSDILLYEYEYFSESGKVYQRNSSASLFIMEQLIDDITHIPEIIFATSVCNKIFTREFIKEMKFFDSNIEDVKFSAITTFSAKKMYITNKCKYFYRKREADASKTDKYFEDKQNYHDHLNINLELYELSKNYPHFKFLVDSFNIKSIPPFIHNMVFKKKLGFKESVRIYKKAQNVLNLVDVDNLENNPEVYSSEIVKGIRKFNYLTFLIVFYVKKIKGKLKAIHHFIIKMAKMFEVFFVFILSYLYALNPKYQDVWLICERGDEARDNGFHFFEYLRKFEPQINAYYLIDTQLSSDYKKICEFGNVIQYRSFKHKLLFILSNKLISSHKGTIEPWNYQLFKKYFRHLTREKKYIFLQHGITKDNVSDILGRENTEFDLFITGGYPEFRYIISNFGYKVDEVVYTGFARFDSLYNLQTKKYILFMPTWRKRFSYYSKFKESNKESFKNSKYFQKIQSFLFNEDLIRWLEKRGYELLFYPHHELKPYFEYFSTNSDLIKLVDSEAYDLQILIKEASLLITDYSSVFFDFAYMSKPVIYYHFDKSEYPMSHYKEGYFNYELHGFGPVADSEVEVLKYIEQTYRDNFLLRSPFQERINDFFVLKDQNNCQRIYNAIIKSNK